MGGEDGVFEFEESQSGDLSDGLGGSPFPILFI